MSVRNILMAAAGASTTAPPGQVAFTTPGTHSWTVPAGVTSVCVVCIGGGGAGGLIYGSNVPGAGGGGGGLSYLNDLSVSPGQTLTISVGYGGFTDIESFFHGDASACLTCIAYGGKSAGYYNYGDGGSITGYGGYGGAGDTGAYSYGGGGGSAGDYSGHGPAGWPGTDGVGRGINGQGSSGFYGAGGRGAYIAAGAGLGDYNRSVGNHGAVRIIWGAGRAFPSTNTGDM